MDRRKFFKSGLDKVSRTAVKEIDARVKEQATRWIRPPYALDELEFLLACTRCDKCIEACPHQVIFSLPARLGAQVAGTPALDLLNKGCRLCEEWPCVMACEPKALLFPAPSPLRPLPQLASAAINTQSCLPYHGPECGACAGSCPVPGALIWDGARPRIDPGKCIGCGLCRENCIVDPKAIDIRSLHRSDTVPSAAQADGNRTL
ncbi:MAG: 4Fe-4S dicluster domain-containing protein [Gammaproteobacteria bacterium]